MFYNHGTKQIGQLNRRKTVAEKSCQKEISFNYEHRRKMMKKKTTTIVVRYSVVTSYSINISISRIAIREILLHVQLEEGIYQVLCQKIKTENTNHGVGYRTLGGWRKGYTKWIFKLQIHTLHLLSLFSPGSCKRMISLFGPTSHKSYGTVVASNKHFLYYILHLSWLHAYFLGVRKGTVS